MPRNLLIITAMMCYAALGAATMRAIDEIKPPRIEVREQVVEKIVEIKKPITVAVSEDAACLAHNIFHEARGESRQGRIQVAFVTLNRVHARGYPDTVCGVVHQKAQFSWTADKPRVDLSDAVERASYVDALALAGEVLSGALDDQNTGATHYYNPHKVDPRWAQKLALVGVWGNHKFMR